MRSILKNIEKLIESNEVEKALEIILDNYKELCSNYEYWNLRGVLCAKVGEDNIAIECFKESIKIKENADAYYNLAYIYEKMGIYSDSAIYYGLAQRYCNDNELEDLIKNCCSDNEILLNIKQEAAKSKKKNFIVLSSCEFGDILQRMHHISKALAKFGHRVMYVSPSVNSTVNSKSVTEEQSVSYVLRNKEIKDKVEIFQPLNVYYDKQLLFNLYNIVVQNLLNQCNGEVIIICYMPYQVKTIKSLKGNFRVIYECVDDHSDLEYAFWGDKQDMIFEQELMDIADVITTTSTSLYLQRVVIEGRNNAYLSKNAINKVDFALDNNDIPKDLIEIPEPRIVYSGAIYEWFDKELFYDLVKSNSDKSFIVIGFGNEEILSEKYDNLHILGIKKHSELKQYLTNCQVGIIPFRDNTDLIINCDPIKQYEYIASGLPVITTNMPEAIIEKINTYNTNNLKDFNFYLNLALNKKISTNEIEGFLIKNSWNERALLICNLIDEYKKYNERETLYKIQKSLISDDICDIPQFKILNAISFAKENKKKFLLEAEKAYLGLKIKFIEKWYVYALIINQDIEKAKEIALNSDFVEEKFKIQLMYCSENEEQLLKVLKYCMRLYFEVDDLYKDNYINKIELATYCYEYGYFSDAFKLYRDNFELDEQSKEPLALKNYSELLKLNNEFYLYKDYKSLYTEIKEQYFKKIISKNEITVMIPTRNRPELLERCINHFENMSDELFDIKVFILDASDYNERKEIKNMLKNHNSEIVSLFEFNQNSDGYQRIDYALDYIKTEHCCLCADDDFLDKDGIIRSLEILKNECNVITVKGESFIFLNNNFNKVYFLKKDSCEILNKCNGIENLNKLVRKWVPQFMWLVYRKDDLKKIIDIIQNHDKELDILFKEYLWYFLIPLMGMVKSIDVPLNIRDENPNSGSYVNIGFYSYIYNGEFNNQYRYFKQAILNAITFNSMSYNEVSIKIDEIMKLFLEASWGIEKKYLSITNGEFDIALLRMAINK